MYDTADVYIEALNEDGTAVIFNGEKVPFIEREVTFEVAGSADVTETLLYVPHHVPCCP